MKQFRRSCICRNSNAACSIRYRRDHKIEKDDRTVHALVELTASVDTEDGTPVISAAKGGEGQ